MTHDEELGARARAMLADFRSDRAPPPQLAGPMLAAIEARLGAPPSAVPDASSGITEVTNVARRLGLRGWFVVGGLAIGAGFGAYALRDRNAPSPTVERAAPVASAAVPAEAEAIVAPPAAPIASPPTAVAAPNIPTAAPVVEAPPRRSDRTAGPRVTSTPAAADDDDLAQEMALLRRAQQALSRGDGAGSQRALDEHARRFPAGKLANEREVTSILVACADDRDAGRVALDRYLAAHPSSPYAERLRTSCGAKDGRVGGLDPFDDEP